MRRTVTTYPDGPALVRGDVEIRVGGEPVERVRGTVALCRCGGSTIAPFCDGTHKVTRFTTGEAAPSCRELAEGEGVDHEDLACPPRLDDPRLRESA
jgi:CDGSH-type Zn-finger protein